MTPTREETLQAELEALKASLPEVARKARDEALEEAATMADAEARGWAEAFHRWRDTDTEAADRCSAREIVASDVAGVIRALKSKP